ncbi:MAG: hypothetical protein QG636_323 [Patescibacteria group bacterium]|nr:hypothetical protein [Patescibacteria group bacterium]
MQEQQDETNSTGPLAALLTAEGVKRSLAMRLMELRIPAHIQHVHIGRTGEPVPDGPNAWQVYMALLKKRQRYDDERPTSLRIICFYDDRILVVASGVAAWEFKRLEVARALERAQKVLLPW